MKGNLRVYLAALAGALLSTSVAAVPQAFVESTGSDGNTRHRCTVDKPCRTFATAMGVVDNGGEIVALDGADYGVVTITKSVAIVGTTFAGISAPPGSDGVTIATPDVRVVLRGLNIRALGGNRGVVMTDGASLAIENCAISNFSTYGVIVSTPARVRIINSVISHNANGALIQGGAKADVVNTQFMANTNGSGLVVSADSETTTVSVTDSISSGNQIGFYAYAEPGAVSRVSITRSTAANNGYQFNNGIGFAVTANAVMTVSNSMAIGNGIGFANIPAVVEFGVGTFESLGNNTVRQNGSPTLGNITLVSGM